MINALLCKKLNCRVASLIDALCRRVISKWFFPDVGFFIDLFVSSCSDFLERSKTTIT